ncbi:hypothetical protein BJX64DRAFT_260980 [Aspergillus heterothallicus]
MHNMHNMLALNLKHLHLLLRILSQISRATKLGRSSLKFAGILLYITLTLFGYLGR